MKLPFFVFYNECHTLFVPTPRRLLTSVTMTATFYQARLQTRPKAKHPHTSSSLTPCDLVLEEPPLSPLVERGVGGTLMPG